jgi:hypothetical protein
MPVDAQARHRLFTRAEAVLGPEPAGTLMELLPTVDWTQVAMKSDLAALEERLENRLGERMERSIRQAVTSQTRWFLGSVAMLALAMMGTNIALVSALR